VLNRNALRKFIRFSSNLVSKVTEIGIRSPEEPELLHSDARQKAIGTWPLWSVILIRSLKQGRSPLANRLFTQCAHLMYLITGKLIVQSWPYLKSKSKSRLISSSMNHNDRIPSPACVRTKINITTCVSFLWSTLEILTRKTHSKHQRQTSQWRCLTYRNCDIFFSQCRVTVLR